MDVDHLLWYIGPSEVLAAGRYDVRVGIEL
jgi:hypothetical protein